MTRLKTICLSLLVCISMCVNYATAQSSSCANQTNISVDSDCEFLISPEVLRATGAAADALSITFDVGTGSGTSFIGGYARGSIIDLGIPNGGLVQYALFGTDDGTGPMLCWGDIMFDVKQVPDPIINTWEVMCGQTIPELPTIDEVADEINGLCVAPITDLNIVNSVDGESCTGFKTIRTINGTIDYGTSKVVTPLRIDTIIETPLTVDMVVGPLGGPSKLDAILLFCDDIDDAYPTPEVVEEFAKEGLQGAYPSIPKGVDTTIVMVETVVELRDTMEEKILIVDDFGKEHWVVSEVIRKRDTIMQLPDTTITDVVLTLRPGVNCNLSINYKDESYPGCAGADSKILRTWNVLDWCTNDIDTLEQWIIIETEGPIIEPQEDVNVGIAPWVCSASYELSVEVDRGCSETLQVTWSSSQGVIEDNKRLTGLWLGEVAEVIVTAVDDCGQIAKDTFYVTPFDSIAPIAIAADEINVSLSGDPLVVETVEDRGIAKVFVDAIDAGSHNAGCGEVNRCLLLKEELENPVIIDGERVYIDGQPIYHAQGCSYDGILPGRPATKNKEEPAYPDILYVVCKDNVKFCCESLGSNSVAMVVTNGGDMQAVTWTDVLVEDKTSPIVICPQPFTVGCEEDYEIPQPVIFNGVCSIDVLEMTMTEDFDNCGDGTKTVVWTRNGDVICTTVITVDGTSGFNPYEIKWPKHYTSEVRSGIRRECELLVDDDGDAVLDDNNNEQFVIVEYSEDVEMGDPFECTGGGDTGEPIWCTNSCGLVGVNFEDQELTAISACKKIVRRWTVIDWCSWDPNTGEEDDDNETIDEFTAVTDEWLGAGAWLTDSRNTKGVACTECDKPAGDADFVYFRYDTVDVDGYYTYDQVIKIIDFDEPVISAPDTITLSIFGGATAKGEGFEDCFASDIIGASVRDFCGATAIDASDAGWEIRVFRLDDGQETLVKSSDVFGEDVTMGTQQGMSGDVHLIRWLVRDGCGNIGRAETYILFVEDKKPTPICIQNLSTSTMSTDGTATIWASDFDAGSFDNCSEVDLFFKDKDGNFTSSLTFECGDIEGGVSDEFNIELYAVDALGNHDFCNVALQVDDFNDNCPNSGRADGDDVNIVSGSIITSSGDRVEDVEVSLTVGPKDMTSVEGFYAFNDLAYSDFTIMPEKDNDYLNGVTALDIVLIQRHLLGLTKFESPYTIIAGDINNDGRLSALDLVDLRRLVLGIYDELPRNTSWRFVTASQRFPNPTSPFPFTEVITISDFDGSERGQNFMAVKIGDVNGNAVANSLLSSGNRSVGMLAFQLEDTQIKKGETFDLEVESSNFADIVAYQYTMELNGLEFISASSGALDVDESNFGLLDANTVTTSWFSPTGITTEDALYSITFRATKDVALSEAMTISSRITPALAYNSDQELLDVGVEYNNIALPSEFNLMQNKPNPWEQSTSIGFELPSAGSAQLTVYDITGKSLLANKYELDAGYQEIILDKSDINSSGVLYYQVDFLSHSDGTTFTSTKKMIVIN